jgi:LmbE family N-acetylglucosaminyl deacetylase
MITGKRSWCLWLALWAAAPVLPQTTQVIRRADERFKADIMIVVAHPDDEAGFTPYLARAIYDLHKRVVVVYGTRGGSGGNNYGREHGTALANIREIEARQACAKLGITNVWFLDGNDTASQNVLNSLANWGHGTNLEKLAGLIRLARPEVVMTNLPGVFFGENHGDHQAAGVLTTEAFDLAGDPTIFPAQVAGDAKRNEQYLENLLPWQPKKLYYSSDMDDPKTAAAYGPSYSILEISPSQKKSYARLALDAATPHLTQFAQDIERISKMSDEQLEKLMNDPDTAWWSEPFTLILGKSLVGGKPTDDVFAHLADTPEKVVESKRITCGNGAKANSDLPKLPRMELGGPWKFYSEFYAAHGLCSLPVATSPEIGIKAGMTLVVPVVVRHDPSKTLEAAVTVKVPEGWKVKSGAGNVLLPAETSTSFRVEIETPTLSGAELKKETVQEVLVTSESAGQSMGEIRLRAKLVANALPE